jgi:hypothetical protein
MLPRSASPISRKIAALVLAGFACSSSLLAQQDGASVDPAQILKQLHSILDQQSGQIKTGKGAAIQQAAAAAGSSSTAVATWEEAVRNTQFEGAGHESTAFQAWKAGDGEAFKDREVQNALHLYFTWLQITLQRSSGAKVKDLLPAIINYAKELAADQAAMGALEEAAKREKEMNVNKVPVRGPKAKGGNDLGEIKAIHDNILKKQLAGSIYVQWQRLMEWVAMEKWEGTPGNFDGIYENVVLPELRDERDPHLLDYWDMMMQKTADEANRSKLAFDVDKYNNLVVPTLLWGKYSDMLILGQKSQAFNGMLSLIKKYPTHPDSKDWISQLETFLSPPPAAAAATPANGSAAAPGAVAPGAAAPR